MRKERSKELVRFGSNVRTLREKNEWTQEQLAERARLDQTYISGIECGDRNLTILSVVKIAAALKTSASTLCEGIDG